MTSPNTEVPEHVELVDPEQTAFYQNMGYTGIIKIHGKIVGVGPFLFTHGILVGMDETGYEYRFCYHSRVEALTALAHWINDGGDEPKGYIKRK